MGSRRLEKEQALFSVMLMYLLIFSLLICKFSVDLFILKTSTNGCFKTAYTKKRIRGHSMPVFPKVGWVTTALCLTFVAIDFLKNSLSVDTCFAVLLLFSTAKTPMFFSLSTEQKAKLLYPEINTQL